MVLPLAPTEALTANAAAPYYVEKLGFKSISFLALNDEWGRQAAEANANLLMQKGVKVVSTEYFLPGESEFGATLTKIKSENPDAIFVASNTREAILIAKKIQELGMTQKRIGVGAWPTNTFYRAFWGRRHGMDCDLAICANARYAAQS